MLSKIILSIAFICVAMLFLVLYVYTACTIIFDPHELMYSGEDRSFEVIVYLSNLFMLYATLSFWSDIIKSLILYL